MNSRLAPQANDPRVQETDRYRRAPLSIAQQQLWTLRQGESFNSIDNLVFIIGLNGFLDEGLVKVALDAVVQRHEILRTTFAEEEGQPYQQIHSELPTEIPVKVIGESQVDEFDDLVRRDAHTVFNLQSGPLLKTTLVKHGDERHSMLVTMHNLIADSCSARNFADELMRLYVDLAEPTSSTPRTPRIQYAEYAVEQLKSRCEELLSEQSGYWQQQLQHAETVRLPLDFPRSDAQSHSRRSFALELDQQQLQRLTELAKTQQTSLSTAMLAVYVILLHRYSQQEDIVVGTSFGCERPENQPRLGLFAKPMAIRTQLQTGMTVNGLVQQLHQTCHEAQNNADLPFDRFLNALGVQCNAGYSPLFQAFFSLSQAAQLNLTHPNRISADLRRVEIHASRFDLNLNCTEHENGIHCLFEYSADLFAESTIKRLVGHFQTLLNSIIEDAEQSIDLLPMLTDAERQHLLIDLNNAADDLPEECLQSLIERQVERTPQSIAVRCGDTELTYQQLNRQANRLAHYLRQRGISRGHTVGICLAASHHAIVAIMATTKAGAAYIPMDINYPADRLQHMVNNAEMSLVMSLTDYADVTSAFSGLNVICLDEEQAPWLDHADDNPECVNSTEDLLYVVYTSGSTGLPKGAGVRHRNESNLLQWYTRKYDMQPDDKALVISALGFDLTQKNLFALLTVGGCVVFPSERFYDPVTIREQIQQHQITIINCAPSVFYPLQERSDDWPQLESLRCVLFGGEPIQLPTLKPWLQQSDCELVNMYGPTECTDIAAAYTLRETDYDASSLPIGRPNSNVNLYVLAPETTQLVPLGVPGELCIGGAGVGIGYLNNDEQTSKVFIDNPFSPEDGYHGKLYRTGDLAKYHQDGNLDFIGRIDNQVKVRGFRIELGEIEATLRTHAAIKESVVVAREDTPGEQRLVAYVVVETGESPDLSDLRAHLRRVLPDYMLPQHLVTLPAMPLTANGKTDRRRLPSPTAVRVSISDSDDDAAAPRDPMELRLCRMWEELLQVQPVRVNDDFFELGGHSMLAVRLMSGIEKEYGQRLPLATLMRARTVAQLAATLRSEDIEPGWRSLVPIRSEGSRTPIFLMHAAGGNLLVYDELAGHLGANQPVYGLQSQGLDGKQTLHSSLEEMATAYRMEIQSLQPHGPYLLGGYCMGGTIALEIATQLLEEDEDVAMVALLDCHNWIKLSSPSLPSRLLYNWQKAYFHLLNILTLSAEKRRQFVRGKFLELKRRRAVWYGAVLRRFGRGNDHLDQSEALAAVWANNDRVAESYQPRTYPGRISQFVPYKNYSRLQNSDVGWEQIARDGVDVQSLPVYPAGMLMEPYVELLASEVIKRIDSRTDTRDGTPGISTS